MCGIIGAVTNNPLLFKRFNSFLVDMEHRGPDGIGSMKVKVGDKSYLFGHTRLAIQDLSIDSNQPFTKHNKTILFNGEIYNKSELKLNFLIMERTSSRLTVILRFCLKFCTILV